ncbi:type II toxin-antitoxin system HicA family toxin [Patescibacteria group bacterium]|nr:type II toxin-antitoxin system HicA family toxin [Patescibacteria group bacterium]MBU4511729.1 type II toxin-antitoxin system HicA family toxin [Patescibacteria group bacterium]MCG2692832.1 type II toxin-antitoxin system HicA family toxin [Candidatus Parcubacteria bacterium]
MSTSINYNEFIKKMRKLGFQGPYSGGKHLFMRRRGADLLVPGPHHRKDIGPDLLLRILKQAGVSKKEFERV